MNSVMSVAEYSVWFSLLMSLDLSISFFLLLVIITTPWPTFLLSLKYNYNTINLESQDLELSVRFSLKNSVMSVAEYSV